MKERCQCGKPEYFLSVTETIPDTKWERVAGCVVESDLHFKAADRYCERCGAALCEECGLPWLRKLDGKLPYVCQSCNDFFFNTCAELEE